jgi:hypothetical protein
MLPLYAARIEDLGPGDFVKVDCAACRHVALLSPEFLLRLRLSPQTKVLDLKERVPHIRRLLPRKCSAQEKRDRRTNNDDTSGGHSDHGKSGQQYNGKSC